MKTVTTLFLVYSFFPICITVPSLWPPVYSVDFLEQCYLIKTKPLYSNNGSWYYDFNHKVASFDKGQGQHDFLCSGEAKRLIPDDPHAPCQILFANDTNMYVIYPKRKRCCSPCAARDYCSVIKPNWLENSTYVGNQTFEDKICYGWEIDGANSKDYWYATDMNVPCEYHQIPYGTGEAIVSLTFKQESYKLSIPDPSIFMVPDYCNSKCIKIAPFNVYKMQDKK